jgi:hypothetical protein
MARNLMIPKDQGEGVPVLTSKHQGDLQRGVDWRKKIYFCVLGLV